jgi:hypothetical protein
MISAAAPILLAVLAIVDAGFAGYRDAAGRSPLIRKERYYRRAVRRGLLAGTVVCLIVGAIVGALFATGHSPAVAFDLLHGASLLVLSFGVYATLVLLALGVWLVAEADVRTLASVLVLGPFTLIRPVYILGSCVATALVAHTWQGAAAPLAAACAQLALEPWLARKWKAKAVG